LAPDDCYAAALHGCVEPIKSGVTTLVDFMYVHPRPDITDPVIRAFEETGIRGFVGRGYLTAETEFGVPTWLIDPVEVALADARRLIRQYNRPDGRVQVPLAPYMIWGVDRETLAQTRQLADAEGALITFHVAETTFEIQTYLQCFGMRDLPYLEHLGF